MTMLKTALYAGVAGVLMASGGAFAQSTSPSTTTTVPGATAPDTTLPEADAPNTTSPDTTTPGTTAPGAPEPVDPYGDINPEAGSAGTGTEQGGMTRTPDEREDWRTPDRTDPEERLPETDPDPLTDEPQR